MTTAKSSKCLARHHHPSICEAEYCSWLYAKVQNGEIYAYKCQPSFQVSKTKRWKADFAVLDNKQNIVEVHEAKGFNPSDANFRLKLALYFETHTYPVFVNKRQVYPSPSGHRIMNLPAKRKRAWPKRFLNGGVK